MSDIYEGVVCYQDGWHMSVDEDDAPDRKLYLDDDGTYRFAVDGDLSWHERKHKRFATVQMEP